MIQEGDSVPTSEASETAPINMAITAAMRNSVLKAWAKCFMWYLSVPPNRERYQQKNNYAGDQRYTLDRSHRFTAAILLVPTSFDDCLLGVFVHRGIVS